MYFILYLYIGMVSKVSELMLAFIVEFSHFTQFICLFCYLHLVRLRCANEVFRFVFMQMSAICFSSFHYLPHVSQNSPTLMRIRSRYQKVPVSQSHANTERPRNGNEEKCNRITGYNRRGNEMCRVQSFR